MGHVKFFSIHSYILEEDPKERLNFGLKTEFFHFFFLKFGLACGKFEASQGFWYQGVRADILFEIHHPDLHNNRCPCYCPFSLNFQAVPPLKLGPPWKKFYVFGILVERTINSVNFV